jgi:hypothetical protein
VARHGYIGDLPRRAAQALEDRFGVPTKEKEKRFQEEPTSLPGLDSQQRGKPPNEGEERLMHAAIHARVSGPRQGREQTIERQINALKIWANENGHELLPETSTPTRGTRVPGSTALGWTACVTMPRMGISG